MMSLTSSLGLSAVGSPSPGTAVVVVVVGVVVLLPSLAGAAADAAGDMFVLTATINGTAWGLLLSTTH